MAPTKHLNYADLYYTVLNEELGTDDSTVLFTTARRENAVHRGMYEFADLTECLVRVSTITVTGGTGEYDLNSTTIIADGDFLRLASDQPVEFHYTDASSFTQYLAGDDLPQRSVRWLGAVEPSWRDSTSVSSGAQLPTLFYLRADGGALYLGLYPVPSTGSSASAKLVVPYVAHPSSMTSSGDLPWTVGGNPRYDLRPYQRAIIHYAAAQMEKLRRDDQASDRQMQLFMGYVQRYLQSMRRKGGTAIRSARRYFRRRDLEGEDPRT